MLKGILVIPEGVTRLEDYCFFFCDQLNTVVLPDTLQSVGNGGLMSDSLERVVISNEATGFKTIGGVLFDIDMTILIDYPVEKTDTHYDIPNGVRQINGGAFYRVENLKTVTFPEGLSVIGERAFNFSGITSVNLPSTMKTINQFAFMNCTGITSVYLNDGLEYIGPWAFGSCWALYDLYIPASVTQIDCTVLSNGTVFSPFPWCSQWMIVRCGAESKPDGWHKYWNCYWETDTPEEYLLEVRWGESR